MVVTAAAEQGRRPGHRQEDPCQDCKVAGSSSPAAGAAFGKVVGRRVLVVVVAVGRDLVGKVERVLLVLVSGIVVFQSRLGLDTKGDGNVDVVVYRGHSHYH